MAAQQFSTLQQIINMKPLIVLLGIFGLSLLITRLLNGQMHVPLSGSIALSAMLLFTAVGHFAFTKGMAMMLPPFIPFKTRLVYITGLIEIAAAIGLLIPRLQQITAWLLILFFLLMLPANIYASVKRVNYEKESYEGYGLSYLWFRIPLQLFFIAWAYLLT